MTCARCHAEVPDDARFCQACGAPVAAIPAMTPSFIGTASPAIAAPYAGIGRRVGAFMIDGFVLGLLIMPLMISFLFSRFGSDLSGLDLGGDPVVAMRHLADEMQPLTFTYLLLNWLYFALMEASPKQATLGKMLVGIRVTGLDEHRISLWRSAGRAAVRCFTTWLFPPLLIVAAFTRRKQAIHDLAAGTLVVR